MKTFSKLLDPKKLRSSRLAAGLSGDDMAKLLGVGKSQISNIENGRSLLDANGLAVWCRACGIENAFDLYSEFDTTEPKKTTSKGSKTLNSPLTVQ